jgi:hypothetical protein
MPLNVQPWGNDTATLGRCDSESDHRIAAPLDLILHSTNGRDKCGPNRRKSDASHLSIKTALSLLLTYILEGLAAYAISMHPIPDWADPDARHHGQTAGELPASSSRDGPSRSS